MADLTIEYFYVCSERENVSVKFPSSDGKESYAVEWVNWKKSQPRWECNCAGFQFRKTCKHVKEVEAKYTCHWHQQFNDGEPVDGKCPQCGGEIKSVPCGV